MEHGTRPAMQFSVAHVPGSIDIALTGQYASWAARIIGLDTTLVIAGEDPEQVRESQIRLARVGIVNVAGYLADGVTGWIRNGFELHYIPQITVRDFVELRNREPDRIAVLDVREPGEVAGGIIENSLCIRWGRGDETLNGPPGVYASPPVPSPKEDLDQLTGGLGVTRTESCPCHCGPAIISRDVIRSEERMKHEE